MEKRVAVIPGDGIGKEVIPVGIAVLKRLAQTRGYPLILLEMDLGADRFLRDGVTFGREERAIIETQCQAVLLGALGDPRVPSLDYARDILFGLRFGLDLYCNIRPIQCLAERLMPLKDREAKDVDLVVFRENTEGVYVNIGGTFKVGTADEIAINEDVNTRKGVERIIRAAFEYARANGRRRVHMADKSNAMKHAHGLWQRTFREVAAEFSDLESAHQYVDALCFNLVRDPSQFDVVVTNNLFGDIVTDLGAALQGGLGMAASANIHPGKMGLFEPVHGSAPDIAGNDRANPLATVLTIGMMMRHLGWPEEEARLTAIVKEAIETRRCTEDVGGKLGTREVGEWVIAQLG